MENALYISFLENRIEELKLLSCDDDCQDTINYCNKLQDELQAVNDDYNNDHKVHDEYEDGLLAEIKELKAENDRLVEQVSSNSGNSSSTHTHTISKEIQDYMNHHQIGRAHV